MTEVKNYVKNWYEYYRLGVIKSFDEIFTECHYSLDCLMGEFHQLDFNCFYIDDGEDFLVYVDLYKDYPSMILLEFLGNLITYLVLYDFEELIY